MSMGVFFLVLTFFGGNDANSTVIIPNGYLSHEACHEAGKAAKANYTGGIHVDWTCVPR